MLKKLNIKLFITSCILFFASLLCYSYAALTFPAAFNIDNIDNVAATTYIAEHLRLPVVAHDDPEIVFTALGTTRSLRPPLTFIVGAAADRMFYGLIEERTRRQRLGAAFIGSLTVLIVFVGFFVAFQHHGVAILGAVLTAFLPKFVFLSSSNNDDIGAIFSASVLFTSVLVVSRYRENRWALIGLAFAVGLVLQTKFTAWLTLPWCMLLCLFFLRHHWFSVIRLLPVLLFVLVLGGGWWPIFNMINYGIFDPTAISHAVEIQQILTDSTPNRQGYGAHGVGLFDLLSNREQFLILTYTSMIGYLEWLQLRMSSSVYSIYGLVFMVGLVGIAARVRRARKQLDRNHTFDLIVLAMLVSQCVFYLHHNLVRDIQPQARYLLPVLMPIMYLFLKVASQVPQNALTVSMFQRIFPARTVVVVTTIVIVCVSGINNLRNHILPSFTSTAYFTVLQDRTSYALIDGLAKRGSQSIDYEFANGVLQIRRTDLSDAYLEFDNEFCRLLPENALVRFTVESETGGGLRLLLDTHGQGTYLDAYWRSFSPGRTTAIYILRSAGCSGARLMLSKNTHSLRISDLVIEDLRIHPYGKPI